MDLGDYSFNQLYNMRQSYPSGHPIQEILGPLEHQAFVREFVQERPLLHGAAMALAIPAYSYAKHVGQPLGYYQDATPASWEEMGKAYQGLGQGLMSSFIK